MEKILILADSRRYIKSDCFQSQLHQAISEHGRNFKIEYFYLEPKILNNYRFSKFNSKSYKFILSTIRQRVFNKNLEYIHNLLPNVPLRVYDQDPWENYIDNSNSKGSYTSLSNTFNLSGIYVPSNFWANYIADKENVPGYFVYMGMLPSLCNVGNIKSMRSLTPEFKGSLKVHRKEIFAKIKSYGVDVHINSQKLSYPKYLNFLKKLGIFVHDESGSWICDGQLVDRSTGMWHKDLEIASQGCFSVRNYHDEHRTYDIDKLPLVKLYSSLKEVKNKIHEILDISDNDFLEMQYESVQYIKNQNYWEKTVRILLRE